MKKIFRCSNCKDIHVGSIPPEECPTCKGKNLYDEISKDVFENDVQKINNKALWRCIVCQDLHIGVIPIENCPTCLNKDVYVEIEYSEFIKVLNEFIK